MIIALYLQLEKKLSKSYLVFSYETELKVLDNIQGGNLFSVPKSGINRVKTVSIFENFAYKVSIVIVLKLNFLKKIY